MPFPGEDDQFTKCPHNHRRFAAGGATALARQVMHTDLRISIARANKLIEDLGIDHGPPRLQAVLAEKLGRIQLECTIHVTHVDPKNHAHQYFPAPGVQLAHPRILAVHAVPQDSIIFFKQWEETLQVMDVKLAIRIHEKNQVFANRLKATHQSSAISLIGSMTYHFKAGMRLGDSIQDDACTILAAIIHNYNLKVLHPGGKCVDDPMHCAGYRLLLVMRRQNSGKAASRDHIFQGEYS